MAKVVRLANTRTPQEFAEIIREDDAGTVGGIFRTAMKVETAHAELGPAQWLTMIRDELKWSKSKGYGFLKIAGSDGLAGVQHAALPSDWSLLVALARLTDEEFQKGLDTGVIHAGMERKDVKLLKPPKPPREPTKKDEVIRPKSLDDWCGDFSVQIAIAAETLNKEERAELHEALKQLIERLTRDGGDENG